MVKLLIYALLFYVAWHFVRRFLAGLGVKPAAEAKREGGGRQTGGGPAEPSRLEAQDLVRCAVCGSYVAARCARTNCPQ
jgi:hypothetical protein